MSGKSEAVLGELITFQNPRGFHNDGIVFGDDTCDTTIVHVHGSLGNFYQNKFLRLMGKRYKGMGIRLLSFNLSAHDGLAEGYFKADDFEYTGGSITEFGTCLDDIEGAVAFAKSFGNRLILQGHSMGCDRVLHYLLERGGSHDFILLSPCDSYQLQAKWIAPETVEQQIERLRREAVSDARNYDWLPFKEYGIRCKDEEYVIPITRRSLLSVMEGPVFRLMRLDRPVRFRLEQRALVYLGGKDSLQTATSEEMFQYLEERIQSIARIFIPCGYHSLEDCEEEVIEKIIEWVQEQRRSAAAF